MFMWYDPGMVKKDDELLTVDEVAAKLKLLSSTIRRQIHDDGLPAVKVGGQWRIYASELNRWIKASAKGKKTVNI